jgi:simple sugar transport system ATP-binding protein
MPYLRMTGITKYFPGVVANNGIDFEVERGEIHALVGENGAGKSTPDENPYGLRNRTPGRF